MSPQADDGKPEVPQPFRPEGVGPEGRPDATPNPWAPAEGTPAPPPGAPGSPYRPPPPKRTSAQIRADMDARRQDLQRSADALRDKVTDLTDWRGQIRRHRRQIVIGAVATGFVVGGLMALRRR